MTSNSIPQSNLRSSRRPPSCLDPVSEVVSVTRYGFPVRVYFLVPDVSPATAADISEGKSGKSTSDLMVRLLPSAESCHRSLVCIRTVAVACGRVTTTDSRMRYFALSCALHLPETPPGLV